MAATSLTLATFIITIAQGMDIAQASPPQPAIGDLKLVQYSGLGYIAGSLESEQLQGFYEVLIYFSNGVDQPGYGGICGNASYIEEATVICNQMGYSGAQFAQSHSDTTSKAVWLKNVHCKKSDLHILRCTYDMIYGSNRTNPTTCPSRFLIKCGNDFNQPLTPYNGKLALCPADNTTNDPSIRQSVSFGMVGLYFTSHGTWKGLETKALLGTTEANTICRQVGFTGAVPGSAVAASASDNTFTKCFDDSDPQLPFRLQDDPWMSTNDVKCNVPQKCFGCCYDYPSEGACQDCISINNLIISCTFDPKAVELNSASAGSESDCQLNSANKPTNCETGSSKMVSDLKVGLGIVSTLLIILGPFGIICLGYLYWRYLHQRCMGLCRVCRRCGYGRVQQVNIDDQPGN